MASHIALSAFVAGTIGLSSPAGADTAADIPDELRDRAARAIEEKKYADAVRGALAMSAGQGITLSTGAIAREEHSVLPSAARFAAYDALHHIAAAICQELKGKTLLVSSVNLPDMRHQYLATTQQLGYLAGRTDQARRKLEPGRREFAGLVGAGLAIDAVGSLGKAVVGLAGLFKSERKISTVADVVDLQTAMLALRSCPNGQGPEIVDATAVTLGAIKVTEVEQLRDKANGLRGVISDRQVEAEKLKVDLATAKQAVEDAKDNAEVKRKAKEKLAEVEEDSASLTARLAAASVALAAADAALDRIYGVVEATGTSPLVTLARMKAILDRVDSYDKPSVLTVKVQHASGYSQVSKAWWRNDRLDFAGGIAVSYEISKVNGELVQANGYYMQSAWMRLEEGKGSMSTGLKRWSAPSATATASSSLAEKGESVAQAR